MTKIYVLYLNIDNYSGYFTGKLYLAESGLTYPGLSAIPNSPNIKIYTKLKDVKSIISLLSLVGKMASFEIIDKNLNTPVYKVTYINHLIESELKF